jgi:hypothetical protein
VGSSAVGVPNTKVVCVCVCVCVCARARVCVCVRDECFDTTEGEGLTHGEDARELHGNAQTSSPPSSTERGDGVRSGRAGTLCTQQSRRTPPRSTSRARALRMQIHQHEGTLRSRRRLRCDHWNEGGGGVSKESTVYQSSDNLFFCCQQRKRFFFELRREEVTGVTKSKVVPTTHMHSEIVQHKGHDSCVWCGEVRSKWVA